MVENDNSLLTVDEPLTHRLNRLFAVVPAYNEAGLISNVLSVLAQVECLSKIVVVDDGSSDGTHKIVKLFVNKDDRFRLIKHSQNHGKADALLTGISIYRSEKDLILMLDADLVNLQPHQILNLIRPVIDGQADMTRGLFIEGKRCTDLAHWLTPWLSGQRCLRVEILEHLDWQAARGYGLETALTLTARAYKYRIQDVKLHGVFHPSSEFHRGLLKGTMNRMKMYAHIFRTWWFYTTKKITTHTKVLYD